MQLALQNLRRNVFAQREFENLFFTVGDLQETTLHQGANVASVEPSILINHLFCVFFILIIALHQTGAFGQDFTVFGQLKLHTFQDFAHTSHLQNVVSGAVHRNHRGCFRQAIALIHAYFGRREEADDLFGDGGAARHHGHLVTTEHVAPFLIHQFIGDIIP